MEKAPLRKATCVDRSERRKSQNRSFSSTVLDNSVFTGTCGNERRGRREDRHAKVNMEQQVWNGQEITDLTRDKKCSLGVETITVVKLERANRDEDGVHKTNGAKYRNKMGLKRTMRDREK